MPKTSVDVILTTAARLFHEQGFNDVSVDQICQECGITKPTFYRYIPTKDDILATYYDRVCDGIALRFSDVYQADSYLEQFDLFYGMVIDSSLELGHQSLATCWPGTWSGTGTASTAEKRSPRSPFRSSARVRRQESLVALPDQRISMMR